MSRRYIHNYLKTHRKRSGLSQEEVSFLLGSQSGAQLSRYENLEREPSLKAALACQAIYRVPVSDLFPGIYTVVESQVKRRAFVLEQSLDPESDDRGCLRKQSFLHDIEDSSQPKARPAIWENPKQPPLF